MTRLCLALCLLALAAPRASAQTAACTLSVVRGASRAEGTVTVAEPVFKTVVVTVTRYVVQDGQKVPVAVNETRVVQDAVPVTMRLDTKTLVWGNGEKVAAEEAWRRLKKGAVLVRVQADALPKEFADTFAPDALILLQPAPVPVPVPAGTP